MVYQRNEDGIATIFITGTCTTQVDYIEARLVNRPGEPGKAVNWTQIDDNLENGVFSGSLKAKGGRFDLEVRGIKKREQTGSKVTVEKVGIGEVFLIVGHSNAAVANSTMIGAASDLVNSINTRADTSLYQQYLQTGNPDFMPPLKPTNLCLECGIAPMAEYPWFWSQLGDLLVDTLHVPVLFYSAAFGGSNMGHFYKAAYNIPFVHTFINYDIRMPYVNIRNAMNEYASKTGLRAILSAHGINDIDTTGAGFYFRSLKVIEKTREESEYMQLAWMIATSCYNNGIVQEITDAQDSLINRVTNAFRGADLNQIDNSGRYDGAHFNESGQKLAAELWRDAITNRKTDVLKNAHPLMAKAPSLPDPPLPVTLIEFEGTALPNGHNRIKWVTVSETNNDYFEILKSDDAKNFLSISKIKGNGDSNIKSIYIFNDESVSNKITYYRLNQVDFNGTTTESRIISIKPIIRKADHIPFPNPAQNIVKISNIGDINIKELILYDMKGKLILKKEKTNQVDISNLTNGNYIIQISTDSGECIKRKITKM
ncbi:T9SS type A sorting domain-containing protein [Dyadobacter sp. NIV53]|uniref:T9SS type A sorting domain-containing protein n=1 Tax=Dyadobacter sp. NIV53 TaxID=2861765 RepID=UPI001E4BEE10|nr:T9SS type A sorting domain-containing protein [Dyadobacter sp. NIV53]